MQNSILKTILVLNLILLFTSETFSIPAFARKYNMSCNVCHLAAPKLKPYGEEFASNGFQLKDKEPVRFFRNTGDDELLLMRELPIALRFELWGQYENGTTVNGDFKTPYILKFLSGGNIFKNVSYYFYFFISERGKLAGIEDAYVMFNDIAKTGLDAYVGQFQASDPLFKRELRLELEDYKIYSTRVGYSLATLKYERGIMLNYTLPTNTDIVAEIVNGNGIDTEDIFDNDNNKNVLLRLSQRLNKNVRVGTFGYYGKEDFDSTRNELWMAGADATIDLEPIQLNVQYLYRNDNNPDLLVGTTNKAKTQGGFVELVLAPKGDKSKWLATLLFNKISSDKSYLNYESYTANLTYLIARNIRLIGEYSYLKETKTSRVSLGLFTAF
ncbi:MAG: hypothetical protein ACP5P3_05935 [Ignavibacteria bacterium]